MAKITFLGSGCWQGVPGQFCEDSISKNVEWNSKDFRFRTCLLLESNDETVIVEITPDIRLQAWKYKLSVPKFFLVSHWHWDHLFGLKDLDWFCEKNNPLIVGSSTIKEWLDSDMGYIPCRFEELADFQTIDFNNIRIHAFPVEHTAGAQGFLFENLKTGKKVVYFGDIAALPENSRKFIGEVDVSILDAVYLEGRIPGDDTHMGEVEVTDFANSLKTKKVILTHISSFHNLDHKALEEKYPQFTIAYDGLELEF